MGAKLYGVGIGPGAPDLLTLRALRVLQQVPVLAIPRATPYSESVAWSIIQSHVREIPHQVRLFLTFPMSLDSKQLQSAWESALGSLAPYIEQEQEIAFACEGDPSLFSTFIYLSRLARERWPTLEVEVVPAVSSIVAVPAVSGRALADGQQRIAVIPALYGIDDLENLLDQFETVILMKMGQAIPQIVDVLSRRNLLDHAVYVAKATMDRQSVVFDIRKIAHTRGDCLSMIIVTQPRNRGVLQGKCELKTQI